MRFITFLFLGAGAYFLYLHSQRKAGFGEAPAREANPYSILNSSDFSNSLDAHLNLPSNELERGTPGRDPYRPRER